MRLARGLGTSAFAIGPALALGLVSACGPSLGQTSADIGADAGSGDAAAHDWIDIGVDGGCTDGRLPLIVDTQSTSIGTAPLRLFVPALYQSDPTVFLLDTGSVRTFLHEPLQDGATSPDEGFVPDAGTVVLACQALTLDGLGVAGSPGVDGKPCVGTLGDDRLLGRPVKLDFQSGQVVWNEPGTCFPEAESWPSAAYDRPRGYVRLHDVALDGTPVKLLVDTGSPDSLWLGQDGRPGDREIEGEDAEGDTVKMYLGTVEVTIGDFQETVPVYRVPHFPYIERLAHDLGGNVDGLFGLSAFRHGIVFDTDERVVRVAP